MTSAVAGEYSLHIRSTVLGHHSVGGSSSTAGLFRLVDESVLRRLLASDEEGLILIMSLYRA
jgi:hypothetical protein